MPQVMGLFLDKLAAAEGLDHAATKALFKAVQKETKLGGKKYSCRPGGSHRQPARTGTGGNDSPPGQRTCGIRIRGSLAKAGVNL